LEEGLHADVIIGLSVTGDQSTTACSVTVSGESGDVIDWTKQPHGRGDSTVDDFDHAEKLIGDGIVEAINQNEETVDSLVVHRNGTYGNEEIAGIQSAVDSLKEEGYIDDDFSWSAVELRDSTSYRIYSDDTDCACRTGAFAEVDESTMVLAPSGGEYTYQGTPRTFRIQERAGTEDIDITEIGRDVFDLSFLVWWSPGSKISDPITTRYPAEMHSLFESCPQVRFLPS
jgi:argonaute-like protein implicated in RNA metabolism and viral defense